MGGLVSISYSSISQCACLAFCAATYLGFAGLHRSCSVGCAIIEHPNIPTENFCSSDWNKTLEPLSYSAMAQIGDSDDWSAGFVPNFLLAWRALPSGSYPYLGGIPDKQDIGVLEAEAACNVGLAFMMEIYHPENETSCKAPGVPCADSSECCGYEQYFAASVNYSGIIPTTASICRAPFSWIANMSETKTCWQTPEDCTNTGPPEFTWDFNTTTFLSEISGRWFPGDVSCCTARTYHTNPLTENPGVGPFVIGESPEFDNIVKFLPKTLRPFARQHSGTARVLLNTLTNEQIQNLLSSHGAGSAVSDDDLDTLRASFGDDRRATEELLQQVESSADGGRRKERKANNKKKNSVQCVPVFGKPKKKKPKKVVKDESGDAIPKAAQVSVLAVGGMVVGGAVAVGLARRRRNGVTTATTAVPSSAAVVDTVSV